MKKISIVCLAIIFSALNIALQAGAAAENNYAIVFYSGRGDNQDIFILHPGSTEPLNLTRHPARDLCPAAAPDGKRIAFLSDRSGNMDILHHEHERQRYPSTDVHPRE